MSDLREAVAEALRPFSGYESKRDPCGAEADAVIAVVRERLLSDEARDAAWNAIDREEGVRAALAAAFAVIGGDDE